MVGSVDPIDRSCNPISDPLAFSDHLVEKARFWIEKIPLIKHTLGRTREPFRTSWDWVFSQRRKYWVVVTLKNGKKYGGKMSSKSYASSYPSNYQIYIEETWEVDENGEFTGEQKENACGVLIVSDEIEAIEFFD